MSPRGVLDGWASAGAGEGHGRDARALIRLGVSGQQQIGKINTVLGTRCFSGLTGQPRLYALLRARSLPRRLIVNHVRADKSNR